MVDHISFLIPRKLSFPKDPGMSLYDNWQNDKKCKFSFPAFLFSAEKCKRTLKTNSAQLSLINLHNFLAVKPKKKTFLALQQKNVNEEDSALPGTGFNFLNLLCRLFAQLRLPRHFDRIHEYIGCIFRSDWHLSLVYNIYAFPTPLPL